MSSVQVVFRTLLKQARAMTRAGTELEFRKPLTENRGEYGYSDTGLAYQAQALEILLPSLNCVPGADKLTGEGLRQVVRENFEQHRHAAADTRLALLADAFRALRVLLEQLYLQRCTAVNNTAGIQTELTSIYKKNDRDDEWPSHIGRSAYHFLYRLRITNHRRETVQIMGRAWHIHDAQGQLVANLPLSDNAIVGQQPRIPPGHCFQYYSGTEMNTPGGVQEGKLKVHVYHSTSAQQAESETAGSSVVVEEEADEDSSTEGEEEQWPLSAGVAKVIVAKVGPLHLRMPASYSAAPSNSSSP